MDSQCQWRKVYKNLEKKELSAGYCAAPRAVPSLTLLLSLDGIVLLHGEFTPRSMETSRQLRSRNLHKFLVKYLFVPLQSTMLYQLLELNIDSISLL